MAATNAQRYTAYSRLYHKAEKAKDRRNADRYWRLAMKFWDRAEKERKARHYIKGHHRTCALVVEDGDKPAPCTCGEVLQ